MALRVWDWRISLDVRDIDANLDFVSHAHSDHTGGVRKSGRVLCSDITKDLVEARVSYSLNTESVPKNVQLLNSGHMFGSRQLYMESCEYGYSAVYTGDYKLQKSFTAEKIEIKKAEVLMMDSTYPSADVVFDDREEVVTAMQHYVAYKSRVGSVIFGAYAMGKAQELIGIFNDIGITPTVDKDVASMTRIYNRHGQNLKFVEEEDSFRSIRDSVIIVNMSKLNQLRLVAMQQNKRVFSAVASGFAHTRRFGTDVQFTLSDHADFRQAKEYIDVCCPKIVYTYGHNAELLAKNLNASGYSACAFDVKSDISESMAVLAKSAK